MDQINIKLEVEYGAQYKAKMVIYNNNNVIGRLVFNQWQRGVDVNASPLQLLGNWFSLPCHLISHLELIDLGTTAELELSG